MYVTTCCTCFLGSSPSSVDHRGGRRRGGSSSFSFCSSSIASAAGTAWDEPLSFEISSLFIELWDSVTGADEMLLFKASISRTRCCRCGSASGKDDIPSGGSAGSSFNIALSTSAASVPSSPFVSATPVPRPANPPRPLSAEDCPSSGGIAITAAPAGRFEFETSRLAEGFVDADVISVTTSELLIVFLFDLGEELDCSRQLPPPWFRRGSLPSGLSGVHATGRRPSFLPSLSLEQASPFDAFLSSGPPAFRISLPRSRYPIVLCVMDDAIDASSCSSLFEWATNATGGGTSPAL
mmetsp:Transcript_50633/g.107890  ORF Transcript_50633/g.107890 Transcript_50633/m.107890 type:complete len:295 (-) Transcript_50633:77-961(-)